MPDQILLQAYFRFELRSIHPSDRLVHSHDIPSLNVDLADGSFDSSGDGVNRASPYQDPFAIYFVWDPAKDRPRKDHKTNHSEHHNGDPSNR
jgi:hypothetical protein